MVQLLPDYAQARLAANLLVHLTISQFIHRSHCLSGLGLLSPTDCTGEVETGTAARFLLLPLVGPAGQQIDVLPSQLRSQLSLLSPKAAVEPSLCQA